MDEQKISGKSKDQYKREIKSLIKTAALKYFN